MTGTAKSRSVFDVDAKEVDTSDISTRGRADYDFRHQANAYFS